MEPIKLAGVVLMVLGILEAFVWRIMAPQNPSLAKIQPLLMISATVSVVIGLALFLL